MIPGEARLCNNQFIVRSLVCAFAIINRLNDLQNRISSILSCMQITVDLKKK